MPVAQLFTNLSLTEVRYKDLRFLITDSPNDDNVQSFIEVSSSPRSIDRSDTMHFSPLGVLEARRNSSSSSLRENLRHQTHRSSRNQS